MFVVYNKEKQKVPIKIWLDSINDIEASCLEQAMMVANHPCIFKHLSLMPDTHTGYSLPIGGVACLKNAVSPYFVGVDIGCGMCAVRTNIKIENISIDQITQVLCLLKKMVPVGFNHHNVGSEGYEENKAIVEKMVDSFVDFEK